MRKKKEGSGKPFWKRKSWRIIFIVIGVLIIFRLFLPAIVLHYSNKALANMDGYYGHVNDIDIALYRGAYQINSIFIDKVDSATDQRIKFFDSKVIDLSIEWRSLFHGSVVGELSFLSPSLRFTRDKTELSQVENDTMDFRIILKKFMPLKINRFEINDGSIHYIDSTASPIVDVSMNKTYMLATNLKNIIAKQERLPSSIKVRSEVYGGTLDINMNLNALAEDATFDLNANLKNTNLVLLNNFLKAYGGFDVQRGAFGVYSEMAADNGKFKGYVKPFFENLKVLGPQDRHDSFFQKMWEAIVGTAAMVFKNPKEKDVATKVTFEGNFHDPKIKIVDAVWELLKNAFIRALLPQIDNEINISSVQNINKEEKKGFFQKIFSKKEKEKKPK